MCKRKDQLSLLDIIEEQRILDSCESENFEEMMDRISELPEKESLKLFGIKESLDEKETIRRK